MQDTRIGASGGEGGLPIEAYLIPAGARICEVEVSSGWFVDSLRIRYEDAAGAPHALPGIGGHGLHTHVFTLEEGEYLIGISGKSGQYVDSIVFHTNRRVSPAYGGSGGEHNFTFLAAEGSEVVGFFGRADWFVDAIGVVTRPLPTAQPAPAVTSAPAVASAPAVTSTPAKPAKSKKAAQPAATEKAPVKKAKRVATPTAPAAPATTRSAPPVAATPDNLEIIEGIGPKIAELLRQNGIDTFAALAATPAAQVREMLLAGGRRFAVADPTSWAEQASLAAQGDLDALKAVQATLKGGRKG